MAVGGSGEGEGQKLVWQYKGDVWPPPASRPLLTSPTSTSGLWSRTAVTTARELGNGPGIAVRFLMTPCEFTINRKIGNKKTNKQKRKKAIVTKVRTVVTCGGKEGSRDWRLAKSQSCFGWELGVYFI